MISFCHSALSLLFFLGGSGTVNGELRHALHTKRGDPPTSTWDGSGSCIQNSLAPATWDNITDPTPSSNDCDALWAFIKQDTDRAGDWHKVYGKNCAQIGYKDCELRFVHKIGVSGESDAVSVRFKDGLDQLLALSNSCFRDGKGESGSSKNLYGTVGGKNVDINLYVPCTDWRRRPPALNDLCDPMTSFILVYKPDPNGFLWQPDPNDWAGKSTPYTFPAAQQG